MHNDVDGVFTREKTQKYVLLKFWKYFSLPLHVFSKQLLLACDPDRILTSVLDISSDTYGCFYCLITQ